MSEKSNIAIVCLSLNFGGMELDAIKLAKKLINHAQIILICRINSFIHKNFNSYFNKNDKIILEVISFRSSFSFSLISNTRVILKKYEIKNLIFFGASELKSLYFSLLGLDVNLVIRHGTTKSKPKKDLLHQLIYSKVNYHVSISKHIEENVKYIVPFAKNSKSVIIYPSFKSNFINNHSSSKIKLLHTGRITNGKGQIDAIIACEKLYIEEIVFEFNIVGGYENDKEKESFLHYYNTIQYRKFINIEGFSKDINKFLECSNIFIFPSYGEGFGNSFVEALSVGLVCLCYENTAFIEFKKLGFYFHMVEDRNTTLLGNKLLYIAKNIESELQKSKKNIELVRKLFNESNETYKYLTILN